ncbi:MAG: HK97 gp10 family phage protein [Methanobrevibacter sp.]|nr:HK97 gp10 family phage protein [Methanobrevibacter sp.]MBQ9024867.1 HK97 gp10 family phage protein [Methanobrevibacter sp.]
MISLSLDVKFNDSYYRKLGLKKKRFEDMISETLDYGLNEANNIARREAPILTGNLRRSITKRKPSPLIGELHSNARSNGRTYWQDVQYGTAAHTITPKNGKFLAFEVNGKKVFARKVNHPGTAPNPFVTRTLHKSIPKFKEYYHQVLSENGLL